jgi:hypothetical protein
MKSKGVYSEKKKSIQIYTYTQTFSFYLQSSKPNPCVNIYIQLCKPFPLKYNFRFGHFFLVLSVWAYSKKPVYYFKMFPPSKGNGREWGKEEIEM